MALQLGALRDAPEQAQGMTPEAAKGAAGGGATCSAGITALKLGLAGSKGGARPARWMVTFNLGLTVPVPGKPFGTLG